MVLARDTSSSCDDHLCQIILKFYNAEQSFQPDTNKEQVFDLWSLGVTLTFEQATWFLHATHRLHMMIIGAKLF